MTQSSAAVEVSCAVEVFIATALLHREQPGRSEFTIQEIINRAARENITGELRSGVSVHASQHCVANKAPNPGKHKMLYATGKHTRRLLTPSDEVHPGRTGKVFPEPGEIPERFLSVLAWARQRYESGTVESNSQHSPDQRNGGQLKAEGVKTPERWLESLFQLEGLGAEYWKDVDPDEFVRNLREGWE